MNIRGIVMQIWVLKLETQLYVHNNVELQILNHKLLNPEV